MLLRALDAREGASRPIGVADTQVSARIPSPPGGRIRAMTTREKIHKMVDALPESELEPVAEIVASHGPNGTAADVGKPGDIVDDWGNLSAMTRDAAGGMLRRLDEQEAAAGFSWDEYL